MTVLLLLGTIALAIVIIVSMLLGLRYLARRRNQMIGLAVVSAGGLTLVLTCAALLLRSDVVDAVPALVRSSIDAAAYLSVAFLSSPSLMP